MKGGLKKLSQPWNGQMANNAFIYHRLNLMSKSMPDTAFGGTLMGKEIEIAKKLLNDMQDNHSPNGMWKCPPQGR
jgi:hypothetical protein